MSEKIAVAKGLHASPYHLVQGPKKSGKSKVMAALIQILTKQKKRVLLANFSNSSIDRVLKKLVSKGFTEFVRLTSNLSVVEEALQPFTKTPKCFESMESIRETVDNNYVFATTCTSVNNDLLLCVKFDYVLMNEAS